MNPAPSAQPDPVAADSVGGSEIDSAGIPLVGSWRGVYVVVIVVFIGWVIVLAAISRLFA